MVSSATPSFGWRPTAVILMQDTTYNTSNGTGDDHADTRFFKMLEVAYNCARNGYYERARGIASEAVGHYDEAFDNN